MFRGLINNRDTPRVPYRELRDSEGCLQRLERFLRLLHRDQKESYNAHDRKVGIRLCACLGLTHSIVLSWAYSTSRISRHRLNVDLFNTLTTRRRLIRQLASSCSTRGRQGKSRMSTYSDLLSTYDRLIPRRHVSNLSIAEEDGSQMHVKTRHDQCPRQKGWNSTLRLSLTRQVMLRQDMANGSQMHVKTRHGQCPRQKGWNSTLRLSWTYAQHRIVLDLLNILNKSTSTYFRLIQDADNSTSTYSPACFAPVPPQGAKISCKCRLTPTYYRLISTYSKKPEFQPLYRG